MTILVGDVRDVLPSLPDGSVQCVVTSPPYYGLRDYGVAGQLGLEPTVEEYVAAMVAVFREVRRVLRDDGTLWLNLGDSYAAGGMGRRDSGRDIGGRGGNYQDAAPGYVPRSLTDGLKPKDLIGIPWRVAFALQQPYYTGSIKDERDRIWLAAMLDAEGCLFIHKRKTGQSNGQGYHRKNDNYGPGVEISNTSLAVIERIMALVGKGSICSQGAEENARRKQTLYRWNLRTTECREFVRELYPYLVAKQHQARILIGCPSSGERAEAAHAALIGLHRGSTTDVDFPPPGSMFEPGYYLRSDIIWSKYNPMPESVTDRPTKAHEYVFLLSKRATYYYDADAVREPALSPGLLPSTEGRGVSWHNHENDAQLGDRRDAPHNGKFVHPAGRNRRTVWDIATQPYPAAHFATFPEKLVEPCILAGTSERGCCRACGAPWGRVVDKGPLVERRARPGQAAHLTPQGYLRDGKSRAGVNEYIETTGWLPGCACDAGEPVPCTVLDIFLGSGTVGAVAERLGRRWIGIELSEAYAELARKRTAQRGLFAWVDEQERIENERLRDEAYALNAEAPADERLVQLGMDAVQRILAEQDTRMG